MAKMNIKKLSTGSHKSLDDGACIMELVSYLAKEPWSDHPQCASESITRFCIWINDSGDQSHRDELMTLAPKIINTRDWKKEPTRAAIFADYALWCSGEAKPYAKYATEYAKAAAEHAKAAAESIAFRIKLYDKAIETLKKALAEDDSK